MPCHAMPCHAMPCHAMPCDAMRCDAMRCDAMRCDAMRCDAMRCDAMRCDAMLCYAMLCYAMLCYAMCCEVKYGRTNQHQFQATAASSSWVTPWVRSNRFRQSTPVRAEAMDFNSLTWRFVAKMWRFSTFAFNTHRFMYTMIYQHLPWSGIQVIWIDSKMLTFAYCCKCSRYCVSNVVMTLQLEVIVTMGRT